MPSFSRSSSTQFPRPQKSKGISTRQPIPEQGASAAPSRLASAAPSRGTPAAQSRGASMRSPETPSRSRGASASAAPAASLSRGASAASLSRGASSNRIQSPETPSRSRSRSLLGYLTPSRSRKLPQAALTPENLGRHNSRNPRKIPISKAEKAESLRQHVSASLSREEPTEPKSRKIQRELLKEEGEAFIEGLRERQDFELGERCDVDGTEIDLLRLSLGETSPHPHPEHTGSSRSRKGSTRYR